MLLSLFSTVILANNVIAIDNELSEDNAVKGTNYSKLIPVVSLTVGESGILEYEYHVEGLDLGPTGFEVLPNGEFAVLDLIGEQVIFCDEFAVTSVSIDGYNVTDIYFDGEELLLHCENDDYIPINKVGIADYAKENVVIKKIADKSVLELISRENKYVNLLRCNDDGFYTYEQSYKPDSSIIWFEDSVCKYNYDGELIGYAIYDTDECVTFPNRPVNVDADGNIYVMLCEKEQVVIYKVILGCDDISHLEEKLKEREMQYQEEVQYIQSSEAAAIANTAPAYTRYQAFLRAISMTRLTWTVT